MRVAINGFGRIGRNFFKIALENGLNIVAINDLASFENLVYLLKYDSVYGVYPKRVELGKDFIRVGNQKIKIYSEVDPENLPWERLKVDVVVESTGFFTERDGAEKHLKAGARKVLISAPGKDVDSTIVLGVNEDKIKKNDRIISMASCTTNCLAPVAKVLNDKFGIKRGFMTTIHAYTPSQNILDGPHKKLRRGRGGAINLVPTTSGATKAISEVIPELKDKLDGLAIRAPVPCGSIVDFVCEVSKKTSVEEVNLALKKYSSKIPNVLEYSEEELVSSDIIRNSHSSIVDGLSTQVLGNMVKVLAWYDNEYGYSFRLVDLIKRLK